MFQREIQANERCIRQRDIPELMTLYNLIQELDQKYGVDSRNQENTFGIVTPDRMLVSELYTENLYYFLGGFSSDPRHLPKTGHVTVKNGILAGRVGGRQIITDVPLQISEEDQELLFLVRRQAIEAAKKHMPRKPQFPEDATTIADYDRILEEQGFAGKGRFFVKKKWIGSKKPEEYGSFCVSYERCGSNKSPHFSTTFKGWQNQEDMPHDSPFYLFYQKWNPFHLVPMTIPEHEEMLADLEEICECGPILKRSVEL